MVTQDACAGTCSYTCMVDIVGVNTIVTNSVVSSLYVPAVSGGKTHVHFLNTKDCIEAAIRGKVK